MKKLKIFTLAAAALLGTAMSAHAVISYTQNFTSGTDAWEAKRADASATYATLANSAGGQSGNCLKITDAGYAVGVRRVVTGVLAGEDYTFSIYYKIPAASGTWSLNPRVFLRQETSAGAAVGSVQYSANLTKDGTWRQVTLTGTIASTATQVSIGIDGATTLITFDYFVDTVSFVSVNNSAQVRTWTGGGADDKISTAGNWDTGVPAAIDSVIFDGSVRLTPLLDSSRTNAGLTFASGAGAFSITRPAAQVLTVAGDIVNSSANLQTIGVPVTINGTGKKINTGAGGIANTAGTVAASGFTKLGSGTLTLSGGSNPNLAGTITVSAGTLALGSADQIANSATLDLAPGTVFDLNGNNEAIGGFAASSTTTPGEVHLGAAQLTISPTATGTGAFYAGDITGTVGSKLVKAGSGEIRLYRNSIANTFERLEVQAGVYRLGHGAAPNGTDAMLGAVPASPMADQIKLSGGTLSFNGSNAVARIDVNVNRGITVSANSTIETLVDTLIPGVITGSGNLTKSGGRYLELSGVNDFSGGLTLAGPVIADSANAIGTGAIIFKDGGSLIAGAEGITFTNAIDLTQPLVASFDGVTNYTLSGDVDLGNGTISVQIAVPSGAVTMSGALTNSLGFVKQGAGTLVLSGTSSYEGATVVSNGTLHVTGNGSTSTNAVTVTSGGKLSGSGTILGSVTVDTNGTLSAGASPGSITTGNLIFNGGGTNVVEVNNATGTQGVNWDLINVNGTLTINANIGNKFIIDPVSLTGGNAPGAADNFDGVTDQNWTIVTTTGGITGYDPAAFDVLTNNFAGIPDGASFRVLKSGNDLVLHYSLINSPLITSQPVASQTVVSGTTVVLSATAMGTEPIGYQWRKGGNPVSNGGNISGADTDTLTIANATPIDSGSYTLTATNSAGSDTTDASVLTVIDPPAITGQPSGSSVNEGGNFNPTAIVTGGGTLVYHWKKDGVNLVNGGNISGADTASLLITGVTIGQTGDYTLDVTNEVGNASSSVAHLKVLAAPVITSQPENASVLNGETATFSVTATGSDLEYQWSRNGAAISGATGSSYSVVGSSSTIGYYTVVVSNGLGTATSDAAKLSITGTPIVVEPFNYADTAAMLVNWGTDSTGLTLSTTNGLAAPSGHHDGTGHAHIWTGSSLSVTPTDTTPVVLEGDLWYTGANNQRNTIGFRTGSNPLFEMGFYNGTPGNGLAFRVVSFAGAESYKDLAPYTTLGTGAANARWIRLKATFTQSAVTVTYDLDADGTVDGSGSSTGTHAAKTFSDLRFGGPSGVSSSGGGFDVDNIKLSSLAPALAITAQPENVSTNAESTVVFSVTAPGATVYQWKKNGVDISGETNSTLTLNSVLKADEGNYSVYIENGFDVTTSAVATLTVADPAILTQPVSQTAIPGDNVSFSVSAVGTGLTYQWKKDGADLIGETTSTLALNGVSGADTGTYTVGVTNSLGSGILSDPATLDVADPYIVTQPSDTGLGNGGTLSLSVSALGTDLQYQWYQGINPIAGATDSVYTKSGASGIDSGAYSVAVTGTYGSVTSSIANVVVENPLIIKTQPKPAIKLVGQSNTFIVVVTGPNPTYQWRLGGSPIAGATESTYTVNPISLADQGDYDVVVANAAGNLTSAIAHLTVNADTNNPVAKMLAPLAGKGYSDTTVPDGVTNYTFIVRGQATDNVAVTNVLVSINGGAESSASLSAVGPKTDWSKALTVVPGTNTLTVRAIDFSGASSVTLTIPFFYDVSLPLTLHTNGVGILKTGSPQDGQMLLVGRPYKLTAVQNFKTRYIFTNWTDGNGNVLGTMTDSNALVLPFIMSSNLTINANFITNPFVRLAGVYNGLFFESTNTGGIKKESAGYATFKVSDAMKLSGKLYVDGNAVSLSGLLNYDGKGEIKVPRSKFEKTDLHLSVSLDMSSNDTRVITGTVSNKTESGWVSDLSADQVPWNKTNSFATEFTNAYTMVLPVDLNSEAGPDGFSPVTVKVDQVGKISAAGLLTDGTKFKQATTVSKNGAWPLFMQNYQVFRTNSTNALVIYKEYAGITIGWLNFLPNTNGGSTNLAPLGHVEWHNPGGVTPAYAAGFTNNVDVIASRFLMPGLGEPVIDLNGDTNGVLSFIGGELTESFTITNYLSPLNKFVMPPAVLVATPTKELSNTNKVTMGVTLKTGLIKGAFFNPTNALYKETWTGVLLQDYHNGAGFFRGTNATAQSGTVLYAPVPPPVE